METKLKQKLKQVKYTRAFEAEKATDILFLGNSRWIRDLELLLEDTWPNCRVCPSYDEVPETIKEVQPAVYVLEKQPYGESELRLIQSVCPKDSIRFVIGSEGEPDLAWKRMQRDLVPYGIGSILLPADPVAAAELMNEVIRDLVLLAHKNKNQDAETIRAAYAGYSVASGPVVPISGAVDPVTIGNLLRTLLSQFALNYELIENALLLAETWPMFSRSRARTDDIGNAYARVEKRLAGSPCIDLLRLSVRWATHIATNSVPTEDIWKLWLAESKLGILARRQLLASYVALAGIDKPKSKHSAA